MEEKVITLLKEYKGIEYEILRVSIICSNNNDQHLVVSIDEDGLISRVKCPYNSLSDVKEFFEHEFPTTQIVVR